MFATKCTCGKGTYCSGGIGCHQVMSDGKRLPVPFLHKKELEEHKTHITLQELFEKEKCTEEEKKQVIAFLFALRYSKFDMDMIEKIIKKYAHLL